MPANGKEPLARSTASTSGSAAVTGVLHRSSRQNQAELTLQRVTCDECCAMGTGPPGLPNGGLSPRREAATKP